jgi:protein arginine N-methyltransferase 1
MCWSVLDYRTVESPDAQGKVELEASRNGQAHGLSVWFDTLLVEGVEFSNAPGRSDSVYGCAFFPFLEPVAMEAGQAADVFLRTDLIRDSYVWQWEIRMASRELHLRQSTFHGQPLSPWLLRKQAPGHVPELSQEGLIQRAALNLMNEGLSLEEIARRLAALYPNRYRSWLSALSDVGELSRRFSV